MYLGIAISLIWFISLIKLCIRRIAKLSCTLYYLSSFNIKVVLQNIKMILNTILKIHQQLYQISKS